MLYLEIDTSSPVPIYEQIMDGIQRLVREEKLAPETLLPSVRQLAADLEINANTVARAYSLLEQRGLVERRRNPADRRSHALYLTDRGRDQTQQDCDQGQEREFMHS